MCVCACACACARACLRVCVCECVCLAHSYTSTLFDIYIMRYLFVKLLIKKIHLDVHYV